jgi:hypothetical protein
VAVAVCAILGLEAAAGYNMSPSERDAAERIAMISHSQAAREKLQTLLEVDQIDPGAHARAPLLSMLTGVGSDADVASGAEEWTSMLDKVTKRQGAGFKLAFYPGNSTVYNPPASKTFKVVPKQMFLLQYADNSALKGFQSRDIVRLGDYAVEAKFGSITDCNSPDFNGVDGIVGFGMPVKQPPPQSGGGGMMGMSTHADTNTHIRTHTHTHTQHARARALTHTHRDDGRHGGIATNSDAAAAAPLCNVRPAQAQRRQDRDQDATAPGLFLPLHRLQHHALTLANQGPRVQGRDTARCACVCVCVCVCVCELVCVCVCAIYIYIYIYIYTYMYIICIYVYIYI